MKSVIELPCSVGDVVYRLQGSEVEKLRVQQIKMMLVEVNGKQEVAYLVYATLPKTVARQLLSSTFFNDTWFISEDDIPKSTYKKRYYRGKKK